VCRFTSPSFGSNGVADRIFLRVKGGAIGSRKHAVGVFVEPLGVTGGSDPIDPTLHNNVRLIHSLCYTFIQIPALL